MSYMDPAGLEGICGGFYCGSNTPAMGFPEYSEPPLYPALRNDTPSSPARVASRICHYWNSSNGNAALAEGQADLARGERGPNQLGYDLSLRDAELSRCRAMSLKETPRVNVLVLFLAIVFGPIGLHRLYLRSRWGIAYLPALYAALMLTASKIGSVRFLGFSIIVLLVILYISDIYRISKGLLTDRGDARVGRIRFMIAGLLYAVLGVIAVGLPIVLFRLVTFPRGL